VSEKKTRLDRYKEIIDQYHLTPEDIKQYITLISIYYYYSERRTADAGRRSDRVNPHPSDVMNYSVAAA
jgi:hypothetical protein